MKNYRNTAPVNPPKPSVLEARTVKFPAHFFEGSSAQFILDNAPVMLCHCSADCRYLFVNQTYAAYFGVQREDVIGKKIPEFLGEEAFKLITPYIEKVLKGERVEYELEVPYARVGRRFMHVSYVPDRDEKGSVRGFLSAIKDITDLKKSEIKMRESEERFRTLTSHAPVGIFQTDIKGDCLFVNENWCKMAGMTPEQAKGKGWVKALHPEDADRVAMEWYAAAEKRVPFRSEYRFLRSDGKITWLQGSAIEMCAPDGTVAGYLGTIANITKRKNAEKLLQNSEERYRAFISQSSEGIWRFEAAEPISIDLPLEEQIEQIFNQGYLAECNDAMARMYGFDRAEDILGKKLRDFIPPSEPRSVDLVKAFVKTGYRLNEVEVYEFDRYGNSKVFLNNLVGTVENGKLLRAWGMQRDITERKLAEVTLRESEERFRILADSAPVLIWVNGLEGCEFVNRRYLEFLGVEAEKIVGYGWSEFVHPEDKEILIKKYEKVFERKQFFESQFRFRRHDGQYRWMKTAAWPRLGANGELLGYVGSTIDITDIKYAEEALRESEQRYRGLVQSLPVAVYACNAEGRITLYNEAAVELWGRKPKLGEESWCGSHKIFDPDGTPVPLDECFMAKILKGGQPARGSEVIIERPDGTRRNVLPHPESLRDLSGKIIGAINILVDITERKQAEQELVKMAAIVESSDDAIISKDTNGMIMSFNPGAERIFGYRADEVIGKHISILYPPNKSDEFPVIMGRLQRDERVDHYESVRRRKDGTLIDVSITASPLYDVNKRLIGVSKIARDITWRKRAEVELAIAKDDLATQVNVLTKLHDLAVKLSAENKLEPALETILNTIVEIHGADFGLASLYDPASGLLYEGASIGFSKKPLQELARIKPSHDAASSGTAFATKKRVVIEDIETDPRMENYREVARDLGFRAVHSTPILTRSGDILGVLSVYFKECQKPSQREMQLADLCARHAADAIETIRSQQALRESEERLRLAISAGKIGTWDWDIRGNNVTWSEQIYEIHGLNEEEFGGTVEAFAGLVHPDDRSRVEYAIKDSIENFKPYSVEMRIIRPNGEVRWISTNARVIPGADGKASRMLGATVDITETRNIQESLYEQLRIHKEMEEELSKSNRELEQFAYIASHDLQEPLHMISSFVDLLSIRCDAKLGEKEKEYLNFVKQGSKQAKTLIEELLEYSRIGKRGNLQAVDLRAVLREVESNLKISITESRARIQYNGLPVLNAAHLEMVQLFQNIISNAIKYRGRKTPEIEIASRLEDDKWLFSVKDNGIGIEPQYQERIFGMFQRLHSKSDYSGTGIGLAICKKIVEHHGGRIWVESQPGKGSTFFFTIKQFE